PGDRPRADAGLRGATRRGVPGLAGAAARGRTAFARAVEAGRLHQRRNCGPPAVRAAHRGAPAARPPGLLEQERGFLMESSLHHSENWTPSLAYQVDQVFEAALQLEPAQTDALCGRGLARARLGAGRGAVADAEAALAHGPRTTTLLLQAACIYGRAAGP